VRFLCVFSVCVGMILAFLVIRDFGTDARREAYTHRLDQLLADARNSHFDGLGMCPYSEGHVIFDHVDPVSSCNFFIGKELLVEGTTSTGIYHYLVCNPLLRWEP